MVTDIFMYLRQFIWGLRKSCSLLILAIRDSELIYAEYRKSRIKISYWMSLQMLLAPTSRCSELFDPRLSSRRLREDKENKRYKTVYKNMLSIRTHPTGMIEDTNVRSLQKSFIRRSFKKLLDLNISSSEAESLSNYGNLSFIISEFLSSCGCPHVPVCQYDLKNNLREFCSQFKNSGNSLVSENIGMDEFERIIEESKSFPLQLTNRISKYYRHARVSRYRQVSRNAVFKTKQSEILKVVNEINDLANSRVENSYDVIATEIYLQALAIIISAEEKSTNHDGSVMVNILQKLSRNHKQKHINYANDDNLMIRDKLTENQQMEVSHDAG